MKYNMIRLLCIIANMNAGGAETFLMKIYRCIDREKYQMDFCVSLNDNYYQDEIKELGGRIFVIPPKTKDPIKSFLSIRKIVHENDYNYVMRVNEHSLSVIDLIAAKLGGAEQLIMRSSNSDTSGGKLSHILHRVFLFLPMTVPTVRIAPSTLAAMYTFGKKSVHDKNVHILHNGLDLEVFKYSLENRNTIRNEFGITNETVIGHVGRFNKQKNHDFLISVFYEIQKIDRNTKLLMVGDGDLIERIKEKAINLGIYEQCIFAGIRKDVYRLLSAMDVFLFPSYYEGMPNTVIEAQTSGLPCLLSDSITPEANVNNLVHFMSLDCAPEVWASQIVKMKNNCREDAYLCMKAAGYDIEDVMNEFVNLVFTDK